MTVLNPDYLNPLFDTKIGNMLVAARLSGWGPAF